MDPFDLADLRRARHDADRIYNEALTALDRAIPQMRDVPPPPPSYDESQIAPLNRAWELTPLKPAAEGWLGRVRAFVWGVVAPLFQQQEAFNAAVVDHINRNALTHRATTQALAETLAMCRDQLAALREFETKLILYAQQITPYVDTKDRYVAGLPSALATGISGLSDDMRKRWESLVARERRYEAQVAEVRSTLSVVQRATMTLKRELEQRPATTAVAAAPATVVAMEPPATAPAAVSLDSYKYVGFEDQFRGSQRDIRERMAGYVADFRGGADVLDVGCGRGEFLDLLREQGITGRGIDLNDEMTAVCRDRGLDATTADALTYLLAQPDGSLGGLFAAQVVEHLEPDYLMRLLEAAYHKLRPGSTIVLETINAACWYAFFSSYIRDLTHVRPLHPDTLRYLLVASGFQRVEVRYSAPFPEESKLQPVPVLDATADAAAILNDNVTKLNGLLFTYLDYAAIGTRL